MKSFSVRDLVDAVRGELLSGDPNTVIASVGTNSKDAVEGMLFIAIIGEKNDGHNFIGQALDAGAAGCLCSRVPEKLRDGKFCVRVKNTTVAYRDLAGWYRAKFDLPVVQVTGSVGKTSTKDMLAAVLSQHFDTLWTEKNYNNEIGTPMTLLRLEERHEAAVIETGMDRAGQIRYLGEAVRPSIAVITNIGDMHIEYLGSRENIFRAKAEIFENLAPDGIAVLNGDDEWLNKVTLPQRIIRAGKSEHCDVRVTEVDDRGTDGVSCTVTTARSRYRFDIPAPGAHMIYPAAMAAAVGEALGLSEEEITRGVAEYAPTDARLRVVELAGGRVLLDDCYNAGPQSMRAALEVLANSDCKARFAVLGDMKELGHVSVEAHREIGALAKKLGVGVIAVGENSRDIAETSGGQWFAAVDEALAAIKEAFAENMTMLVKASHSMHFEHITEELTKDFKL